MVFGVWYGRFFVRMSHKNKLSIVLVTVNYYFDPPDIIGGVGYLVHKIPAPLLCIKLAAPGDKLG
jgi:hypothetical protein